MKNKFFMPRIFVFAGFAANFQEETDKNIDDKEAFASDAGITQRYGD